MGMSADNGGGAHNRLPMSEINVTPLVDVMLVLLIIFMVTAPMMISGVEVDLPQSSAAPLKQEKEEKPLTVTVTADGAVYINDTETDPLSLRETLTAIRAETGGEAALVRGDAGVPYGAVMKAVGALNKAGYSSVSLLSEPGRE